MTGWTEEEALGLPVQDVFRIINERTCETAEDIIGRVVREHRVIPLANHTALVSRTGVEIPIEDSAAPIWDRAGSLVGVVLVFRDVTTQRRMQEALRTSEERLRFATLSAGIGVWSWTPGTSNVIVSADWRRLFGIAPEVPVTFETWRDALHPDDRARAVNELNAAAEQHREFNVEYRVVRPDGSVRWIVDRGRASYDEQGRPVSMAGMNVDLTERRQVEQQLRESEERYRSLFTSMSEGFAIGEAICDERGRPVDFRFLEVNDALRTPERIDASYPGQTHAAGLAAAGSQLDRDLLRGRPDRRTGPV